MTRNPSRFHRKTVLSDRQLRSFDVMVQDPIYTWKQIQERFGLNIQTASDLAKERNLVLPRRKQKGVKTHVYR